MMRTIRTGPPKKTVVMSVALALFLSGCSSYDYLQNTDRVAYSAGDAVKANLEAETLDPSDHSRYHTTDLGENGVVVDPDS